jgi:hypothetical protein
MIVSTGSLAGTERRRTLTRGAMAAVLMLLAGCGGSNPSQDPPDGGDPTPMPGATPTPAPTATPSPSPSATPTPAPSSTPTPAPTASPSPTASPDPTPAPTPSPSASLDAEVLRDVPTMQSCDFLDRSYCQFPWPNDFFTTADATTDTGRRVALDPLFMPRNVAVEWNRNDGFSPGQMILVRVPGLDLEQTGAAPLTDIASSLSAQAPIAVYDLGPDRSHVPTPQLVWAELDANITAGAAASPLVDGGPALIVRPAVNFRYGHRYAVVLRNLRDAQGETLEAPAAFRIYRDNAASAIPAVQARRAGFEALFAQLALAGVQRSELYTAWEFTVASRRNLTERILHMRDETFAGLGAAAPAFSVSSVIDNPATGSASAITARRIRGRIEVPCYLNTPNCASGGTLNYSPGPQGPFGDGLPDRLGAGSPLAATAQVPFICSVARSTYQDAADPAAAVGFQPARPALYGHGLLGSRDEGNTYDFNVRDMAQEHGFLFCMVDWAGMATGNVPDDENDPGKYDPAWDLALQDAPTVASILLEMGQFPKLADRVQQGLLNFMVLGRAMLHEDGLCSHPAFQVGGACIIDRSELFYDGNSQGGIIGGALVAVSPDLRSAVLGVPGMNYSTLLSRSVDFDFYAQAFYNAYPNGLDQQFIFSLIQMLWDRAETNGYAQALAPGENLPGTPEKRVLLHVGFSDHQVSMTSAEVMTRTLGGSVHCPAVIRGPRAQRGPAVADPVHPDVQAEFDYLVAINASLRTPHPLRRHHDDEPYFAIPCAEPGQAQGNVLVVWDRGPRTSARDNGAVPPPTDNTPPRPELGYGGDPHGDPRNESTARVQKSEWLRPDGRFVDVCDGQPCGARGFVTAP